MSAFLMMSSRQRLQALGLALLVLAGLLLTLLLLLPAAALALLAALAVGLAALMAQGSRAVARAARPQPSGASAAPTLRLTLASGEEVSARPVSLPHPDEHMLLLTRDGYVVANAEGRVIHRL